MIGKNNGCDPINWYNKPYMITPADFRTDLSTPKDYGQKLLNRKRGRK